MRLRTQVIKGGRDLLVGQIGQQGFGFLRNIIIARLVSPEDFGIAATFAVILAMLEAISYLGVERFIVYAPDGDTPEVQSTLQLFTVVKGLCLGLCMFLSADLLARLFGVPQAAWAYQWLAIVPVLRGFMHLDLKRLHRKLAYRKDVASNLWSQGLALVAALAFGFWLRSYQAILWSTLVQAGSLVLLSHILCERRYSLAISKAVLHRVVVYGWPLLLNGFLLFATSQSDQFVVGSLLGMPTLGLYAAAALIPVALSQLVLGTSASLFQPVLSGLASDRPGFEVRYDFVFAAIAVLTIVVCVPLIAIGHVIIPALLGQNYQATKSLVAWLAIGAAARMLRGAPTIAALALGDTKNLLYANSVRLSGIAAALAGIHFGHGIESVAAAIAMGELLATVYAAVRLSRAFRHFDASRVALCGGRNDVLPCRTRLSLVQRYFVDA